MSRLGEEIPYRLTITIDSFKEIDNVYHIHASIWVEKAGQKAIVIGKQGRLLKIAGQEARIDLEKLFDKKVNLKTWVKVKNKKIENYQAVVPSTWNASPRCENKTRGQYEESLIGVPVPDPDNPINIVRVIRSFDPCLACAVHLVDPQTNEIKKFLIE